MDINQNNHIVCLDIGTSQMRGIVIKIKEDYSLELLAYAFEKSKGIKKGVIVDFELLYTTVGKLIEKLENTSQIEIERVYVSITGEHIYSINSSATIRTSRPNKEISREDIGKVIYEAKKINIPSGKEILHVIPVGFSLDGTKGIKDPFGLVGQELGVEVHIIMADSKFLLNYKKVFEKNSLEVVDFIYQGFASAESILTEEEKEVGSAVLNFGEGVIDGIVYKNGGPVYSQVWPFAGDILTKDISFCLEIPYPEAREIKEKYGLASVSLLEKNEMLEIEIDGEKKRFSREYLCEIIESRLPEILSFVWKDLGQQIIDFKIPVLIITGGEAKMNGLPSLWKETLEEAEIHLQIKTGYPQIIEPLKIINIPTSFKSPEFSTLIGVLVAAIYNKLGEEEIIGESLLHNTLEYIKDIFNKIKKTFNKGGN